MSRHWKFEVHAQTDGEEDELDDFMLECLAEEIRNSPMFRRMKARLEGPTRT